MAKKTKDDDEKQEESSGGSIAVNDAWTGMLVISLLALMIGTGFLFYDWWQYYGVPLPTVPKLTGSPPGTPPAPQPKEKEPEKEKKDLDKKAQ